MRKEEVAWRIRVQDATGKQLDDKSLKSLVVEVSDGQKFEAHFKDHPPRGEPTDHFWSLFWTIPADFPTGSLDYKVLATMNDGSTVEWVPFIRPTTQLMIVAGDPVPAAAK